MNVLKSKWLLIGFVFLCVITLFGFSKAAIRWVEYSNQIDIQYEAFDIDLLPTPALSFHQLKVIDNKRDPNEDPLITAEQFKLVSTLGSLLGGRPEITLVEGEQIKASFSAEDNERFQSSSSESPWSFPVIRELGFKSVDILYSENSLEAPTKIRIDELSLSRSEKLKLSGAVAGSEFNFVSDLVIDANTVNMPNWVLLGENLELDGSAEYDARGRLPSIDMKIYAEELQVASADKPEDPNSSPLLLSDDLLPLDLLRDFDANIEIEVKKFSSGVLVLENLRLPIKAKNGVLKAGNASADFAEGQLLAALEIDYAEGIRASWKAAIDVRKSRLSELTGLADMGVRSAARSAMLLELQGFGRSSREFMATSQGKIQIELGEFLMESKVMDAVGGDILLTILDRLKPDTDDAEYMEFHCGAVNLVINDGKMSGRKKIIFQTGRADVLGNIDVDFHNEEISLTFSPSAKGGVGVNLNEFTGAVKIGGHLSRPKLQVNAMETAKIGLGIWASANTGGASKLAQTIFKKIVNRNKSCHNLLPTVDESAFLAQ